MPTPEEQSPVGSGPFDRRPKRYDVYVSEPNCRLVLYSNVRFIAATLLLTVALEGNAPRFVEIEQPNGQIVYVPRGSIVKFCEHGVVLLHEVVSSRNEEKS